jgi:hypothetical protein
MPEQAMLGTEYSTRGDIEHQVISLPDLPSAVITVNEQIFMIGGILFFVLEMKLGILDSDNLAQLFLEFLCMCHNDVLVRR